MFDESSYFQTRSTSSPGCHITSCSNSKHMRYEGYDSLSVDPNLLKRSLNMVVPPRTWVNVFVNYLSVCVFYVDAIIELNKCLIEIQPFEMDQFQVLAVI